MPFLIASQPCWVIRIEGDRLGCGASFSGAVRHAGKEWEREIKKGAVAVLPPTVTRDPADRCVLLRCAHCGVPCTDDEGFVLHTDSVADAVETAEEWGWVWDVCPDGLPRPRPVCTCR
jgi:hypothetical protein